MHRRLRSSLQYRLLPGPEVTGRGDGLETTASATTQSAPRGCVAVAVACQPSVQQPPGYGRWSQATASPSRSRAWGSGQSSDSSAWASCLRREVGAVEQVAGWSHPAGDVNHEPQDHCPDDRPQHESTGGVAPPFPPLCALKGVGAVVQPRRHRLGASPPAAVVDLDEPPVAAYVQSLPHPDRRRSSAATSRRTSAVATNVKCGSTHARWSASSLRESLRRRSPSRST